MQSWETPLHFACKFGHVDIVEYLVSHPLTDVQRPNKYQETPAQVRYNNYWNINFHKSRVFKTVFIVLLISLIFATVTIKVSRVPNIFGVYSQLSLTQTPLGPAQTVHLREVSVL